MSKLKSVPEILCTTNVRRNWLAEANNFASVVVAMCEPIMNSLQYLDEGVKAKIKVAFKNGVFEVRDNGRGMDLEGLRHFFEMHGRNKDVIAGQASRGQHGTGKSAAFKYARFYEIITVKNGRRIHCSLHKKELERTDADHLPLGPEIHEIDVPTSEPNGTIIRVTEIVHPRMPSEKKLRDHLSIELSRWGNPQEVYVNGRQVVFTKPAILRSEIINLAEFPDYPLLAKCTLEIDVTKNVIEPDLEGLHAFARGIHCGKVRWKGAGQDSANRIWARIDVPELYDSNGSAPAMNSTRDKQLSDANQIVQQLEALANTLLERTRRKLARELRAKSTNEADIALNNQAMKIAALLNKVASPIMKGFGNGKKRGTPKDAVVVKADAGTPVETRTGKPSKDKKTQTNQEKNSPNRKGRINLIYGPEGRDESRTIYDPNTQTIILNTDHPSMRSLASLCDLRSDIGMRFSTEIAIEALAKAIVLDRIASEEISTPEEAIREQMSHVDHMTKNLNDL